MPRAHLFPAPNGLVINDSCWMLEDCFGYTCRAAAEANGNVSLSVPLLATFVTFTQRVRGPNDMGRVEEAF